MLYLDIWLDGETVSEDDYDNRQSPWENRQSPWESRLVVGLGSSTTRQSQAGLNNGQQDPANVIRHHDPGQQMLAIAIPTQHYLSETLHIYVQHLCPATKP
ncbi:hypothetical protein PROH_15405 [Prochlorothrix hollandica PCC 9006 = CALU 1027]|uniref:Uncharacterized protein n=1 Tax=Prochlorothrix hollandica PCC 9006 = CALU 1027 TaxID=317619 RepID=A0A0M2PSQ6_PROHO|nr:hypothetical protein PROH_15405 [Prochlorothrix hollandica PCC 9006 = CALU 1027]